MPILVIAKLLGVDETAHRRVSRVVGRHHPELPSDRAREEQTQLMVNSILALRRFFEGEIAERRARPRDDLITDILEAQEHGTRALGPARSATIASASWSAAI